MTDGILTGSQVQPAGNTSPVENVTSTQPSQPVQSQSTGIPQEKIDEYIKMGYAKGYQKALGESQTQPSYAPQVQQPAQPSYQPPVQAMQPNTPYAGQMQQPAYVTPEQVRQIALETNAQTRYEAQKQQLYNDFSSKVLAAKESRPDFDQKVSSLITNMSVNPADLDRLVSIVNAADNAADITYELATNPHKIKDLLHENPYLAQAQLQHLSNSIKQNQKAESIPRVNPPLSQMQPSNIGTGNGSMSIDDYAAQDWARF